ncbi:MAG: hypothetical protein RLZZ579_591 [Actinomycetota bacterium]
MSLRKPSTRVSPENFRSLQPGEKQKSFVSRRALRKSLRGLIALLSSMLLALGSTSLAGAEETLKITGTILLPAGIKAQSIDISAGVYNTKASATGEYEVYVPKGVEVNFGFRGLFYSDERAPLDTMSTYAGWSTKMKFTSSTQFNLSVPEPKKLEMSFYDASNNPLQVVSVYEVNGNQPTTFSENGRTWTGLQRLNPFDPIRKAMGLSTTGTITAWIFPVDRHQGFFYSGRVVRGQGVDTPSEQSGTIDPTQNQAIKLCVPFNFGPTLALPADCYKTAKQEVEDRKNTKPTASAAPKKYKNCAQLNEIYAGGVSKSSKAVNKGSKLKFEQTINSKVYELNKGLDRDKDGIACER